MLYEFVVKTAQQTVNQKMEKLNAAGLFNLYYEQPIEVDKVQNGYSFHPLTEQLVDLKIYGDEEEERGLPDSYLSRISEALTIPESQIAYQKMDNQWSFELDDIDLGNGWIIRYGNQEYEKEKNILQFNPQAAFGTGLHETTQDCLRVILNEDFSGKRVLDLGTGSGILSVGALLRNAGSVEAIDYQPTEREVFHNVKLNQLPADRITALQADLLNGSYQIRSEFDWIFINIGANETVEIINRHRLLGKSSTFLISGLVEWHVEEVLQTFKQAGFEPVKRFHSNEWITLCFERKSTEG